MIFARINLVRRFPLRDTRYAQTHSVAPFYISPNLYTKSFQVFQTFFVTAPK